MSFGGDGSVFAWRAGAQRHARFEMTGKVDGRSKPRVLDTIALAPRAAANARIAAMRLWPTWFLLALAGLLAACAAPRPLAPTAAPTVAATPADRWLQLFQHTPYPFTAPLPPAAPSALDGVYVKRVDTGTPTVHCVRCPEYAPYDGLWKLSFDDGIFRVYHTDTGWRGLGSYTVAANEVTLFNDPTCPELSSRYTFTLADGQLMFTDPHADPCAIRLRTMNFTQQPWSSCQPPNSEAAISGHWPAPDGCQ